MRRLFQRRVLPAAVWITAAMLAQTPAPQMDKTRIEAFIRHLMLWGPQIQVSLSDPRPSDFPGLYELRASASYQQTSVEELFYASADGKYVIRGSLFRTDQPPYAADAARIHTEGHPSFGAEDSKTAPLQLVIFSDFQCNFCREEARSLRENLPKTYAGKFRLVFRDMPLEQIHPWAKTAAVAGRCAFRQSGELFWKYHDWIFDKQGEITSANFRQKALEWLRFAGGNEADFAACLDSPGPAAEVAASAAEARRLRIQSTPTLFVNGRMLTGSIPWPQLKAILDLELDFAQKAASAAGCCTLTLPVLPKPH
jgi:protein-disulfide isomerase